MHNIKAFIAPLLEGVQKVQCDTQWIVFTLYCTDILPVHENDTVLPSDLLKQNLSNRNHFPIHWKAVMLVQRQNIIHIHTLLILKEGYA